MILTTVITLAVFSQRLDPQLKPPPSVNLKTSILNGLEMTNGGVKVANNVRFVNWRDTKRTVTFKFASYSKSSTKMTAVVWGFGQPNTPPAVAGEPVPAKTGKEVGRIVYVQDLGSWSGTKEFSLDSAQFGPTLKKPMGFILLSQDGSDNPAFNALKASAEAQKKQNESDALFQIGAQGSTDYVVQVVGVDGSASTTQTIRYGEPAPGPGATTVQVMTRRATAEFPEPGWGNALSMQDTDKTFIFRWNTKAKGSKAIVQVMRGRMSSTWALWDDPKNEVMRKSLDWPPMGRALEFNLDLSALLKEKAGSTFTVRVVPLTQGSDLAGVPSAPIVITRASTATPVPAQTPKLKFDVQLIGWQPAYLGSPDDPYRFVVGQEMTDDVFKKLEKLAGKPLHRGDKVFLPPKPPQKETAWYEKAKATIKDILTLKNYVDMAQSMFAVTMGIVENLFAELPGIIAKKLGANPEIVDKAMAVANYPLRLKAHVLNAAIYVEKGKEAIAEKFLDEMGVQDPVKRNAMRGNVQGMLSSWAEDNKYKCPNPAEYSGLIPDPDFIVRPAVAFIRITAKPGGAPIPSGYREQAPTVSLNVGAMARDAELLGTKDQYYPLYQLTASPPTFAANQTMVLVLPMQYHWSHESKLKDWLFGTNHVMASHYNLNGKLMIGKSLNDPWGDTDGE